MLRRICKQGLCQGRRSPGGRFCENIDISSEISKNRENHQLSPLLKSISNHPIDLKPSEIEEICLFYIENWFRRQLGEKKFSNSCKISKFVTFRSHFHLYLTTGQELHQAAKYFRGYSHDEHLWKFSANSVHANPRPAQSHKSHIYIYTDIYTDKRTNYFIFRSIR